MPKTKEQEKSTTQTFEFTEEHAVQIEKIIPTKSFILFAEESKKGAVLCIRNMSDLEIAELMERLSDALIEHNSPELLVAVMMMAVDKLRMSSMQKLFTRR